MSRSIQSVEDLQPLLDFYAGTLGELPGRLMAALSILADLEYMEGWDNAGADIHLSINLAAAITADVFKRLLAEQPQVTLQDEVEAMLEQWIEKYQKNDES